MQLKRNNTALALEELFENSMVVQEFEQNRIVIDYSVIVNDLLIEVEQVESKEEILQEQAKLGWRGKLKFLKHKELQAGKFLSAAFYYLVPAKLELTEKDVPKAYGIISYRIKRDGTVQLEFVKLADYIHKEYLTRNFYKALSMQLLKAANAL